MALRSGAGIVRQALHGSRSNAQHADGHAGPAVASGIGNTPSIDNYSLRSPIY